MIRTSPTAVDTDAFRELGIVKVEGLIAERLVVRAREKVYDALAREGLWRAGAWAGDCAWHERPRALKQCSKSSAFASLLTERVIELASVLAGSEVSIAHPRTQLLFTPPHAATWAVPHSMWHLDYPRLDDIGLLGTQMFTFLDTVPAGGGGTLLIAGSHRLLNNAGTLGSKEVKRRLAKEPYFARLMDKRHSDRSCLSAWVGNVGRVPLKIIELTGAPGDVYFTDLRLLHSLGPNATSRPRLMVTQRFPRLGVSESVREAYETLVEKRSALRRSREPANER